MAFDTEVETIWSKVIHVSMTILQHKNINLILYSIIRTSGDSMNRISTHYLKEKTKTFYVFALDVLSFSLQFSGHKLHLHNSSVSNRQEHKQSMCT